ncbi:hypothetical protein G7046_g2023 [Stylonectria norvegica]|nr:hypothetical protein G7046_g2023 [Stylonectria norvegica]
MRTIFPVQTLYLGVNEASTLFSAASTMAYSLDLMLVHRLASLYSSSKTYSYIGFPVLLSIAIFWKWTSLCVKYKRFTLRNGGYFINREGESIPEIDGDTRFTRFSHGRDLSQRGAAQFGSKPYMIWNNTKSEIVLSTSEHIKEFYSRQAKEHGKPPSANMGNYFHRLIGECVGVQNGQKWKTIRKVFEPQFSHRCAAGVMPVFEKEISRWRESSEKKTHGAGKFTVDAVSACRILPFKLIAIALFGREVMTDERFERLLDLNVVHERIMLNTFFGRNETSTLYNKLWTSSKREMDFFLREWRLYVLGAIEDAEKNHLASPIKEIHAAVLEGIMSEKEFLQTVDEILFANLDVMSSIIAFLLINLSMKKEAQDELRQEILDQRSSDPEGVSLQAYAQRTDTLLEYTCMESIRLCPAAWFTLPEHATADIEICGFRIKAGTPCIIDWNRLNSDSPIWSCETPAGHKITGTTFYPRRFETLSATQYRWSFLRFGMGSRQCLGKNYGTVIMKQFLISVLGHYELFRGGVAEKEEVELREDRFTVTPAQDVTFVKL